MKQRPQPIRKRATAPGWSISEIERAIEGLEAALDPLFAAGRYREFFQRAHHLRTAFGIGRLPHDERTRLWDRLNRCTERAKARQEDEFADRHRANLARWREQLLRAEGYSASLTNEIAELAARRGPPAELDRWQRRITEKQARLASVEATIADLSRKIADLSGRIEGRTSGP